MRQEGDSLNDQRPTTMSLNSEDAYGIIAWAVTHPDQTTPHCLTLLIVSDTINTMGYERLKLN